MRESLGRYTVYDRVSSKKAVLRGSKVWIVESKSCNICRYLLYNSLRELCMLENRNTRLFRGIFGLRQRLEMNTAPTLGT